jgi:uncharacterized membrane protein
MEANSKVNPEIIPDGNSLKKISLSTKRTSTEWLIPAGLILLSAIPIIAGASRVVELTGGAEITADNARFLASPLPVLFHIICATFYSLAGAFQFTRGFRHAKPRWHRYLGRILIPCGLVVALSGLWMAQFYPWPKYDGIWLYRLRLMFGIAMFVSLVLGYFAARKRDFTDHASWMIRAYAIGLGAGTQVFTHLPWLFFPSIQGEAARTIMMGAGWVINLAVAEWIIRRQRTRSKTR